MQIIEIRTFRPGSHDRSHDLKAPVNLPSNDRFLDPSAKQGWKLNVMYIVYEFRVRNMFEQQGTKFNYL